MWAKRSIIEHLAKFREFNLENHVIHKTSKLLMVDGIIKKRKEKKKKKKRRRRRSEDLGIKIG